MLALVCAPAVAQTVELSEGEQRWVNAHPVVRVAHAVNGPFAFLDHRRQLSGLSLDTLTAFSQRCGLRFESVLVPDLNEAFDGLRAGRFDAVMGIGRTVDREAFMRFAAPYAYSPDAIVSRTDGPFVFDVRDLGRRRVGLAKASVDLARTLATSAPAAELVFYDTMEAAVLAVAHGDVFISVTDASVAAFTVKEKALSNLRVAGIFGAPGEVEFGVRPDWPELATILDKTLAAMPAAERTALTNRWMPLDYESDRRWQRAFTQAAVVLALLGFGALALLAVLRKLRQELKRRHQAERELEKTLAELARISQEKTDLLRMVAHDLRNPLTALLMNIDFLAGDDGPADRATLLDMRNSIEVMRTLVALLVDQQAVEAGQRTWTLATFDASHEVLAAVGGLTEVAKYKTIDLVVDAPPGLPPLTTDKSAFRQVVDNLVSNAVKYSPERTTVRLEVQKVGEALELTVRDQGPGVPPEQRERIFQKYQTGSAKPTGAERSIGLGLWIVSRLVTNLHGRVWCEGADSGGGGVFKVQWPLTTTVSAPNATDARR